MPAGIKAAEPVTETVPADTVDDEDTRTLPTRTPAASTPATPTTPTTTFTATSAKTEDTHRPSGKSVRPA